MTGSIRHRNCESEYLGKRPLPKSAYELAMERLRQKDKEANLRRDNEMLANDRDRKIAEIRRQGPSSA